MKDTNEKNIKTGDKKKKDYESPKIIHHDPLKSVSTTVYYYTYY